MSVSLIDSGLRVSLKDLSDIFVGLYSESQRIMVARCDYSIEGDVLRVVSPARNQCYEGVMRLVLNCTKDGMKATYDAKAFEVVRWSEDVVPVADQPEGGEDIGVRLVLEEVSSSLVRDLIHAAISATLEAERAAERANNIADVHKGEKGDTGPEGPRGPEGPQGPQGVQGPQGERGPEGPQGPQGERGPQGEPGPQGATGPQGLQGNSGYQGAAGELEVVNNLTQGGATAALSAEQGKVLKEEITELDQRLNDIEEGSAGGDSVLVAEDGFFFTDAQGYVGVKIDATGLHAINLVEIE